MGAGAMGVPCGIVYVECDRLGADRCKPLVVSVCILVAVYSDMRCVFVWEYIVGTGGKQVRYLHPNILNKA